jgi:lantibiotic transport system permease protein
MNLLISLRSEILKTKRTASFYFTLIGAAVVPFIFLINICLDGMPPDLRKNPFNDMFKAGSEMNGLVIFPMFVILVCTLLPQIEYRNNTWKQVVTSPQTKANVFMAKFLNIHLLMLLFLIANQLFMFLVAVLTHFIEPDLDLLHQPLNGYTIFVNSVYAYVTILAICAVQFWLGLRFKNFIIPIAIGLALWLTGTLLVFKSNSGFTAYFPYGFQIFNNFPEYRSQLNQVAWTSFGYAVLFLVMGFLDFRRRRMKA